MAAKQPGPCIPHFCPLPLQLVNTAFESIDRITNYMISSCDPFHQMMMSKHIKNSTTFKRCALDLSGTDRTVNLNTAAFNHIDREYSKNDTTAKNNDTIMKSPIKKSTSVKRCSQSADSIALLAHSIHSKSKQACDKVNQFIDNTLELAPIPHTQLVLRFIKFSDPTKGRPLNFKKCYDNDPRPPRRIYSATADKRQYYRRFLNTHKPQSQGRIPSLPLPPQTFGPPKPYLNRQDKSQPILPPLKYVEDDLEEDTMCWAHAEQISYEDWFEEEEPKQTQPYLNKTDLTQFLLAPDFVPKQIRRLPKEQQTKLRVKEPRDPKPPSEKKLAQIEARKQRKLNPEAPEFIPVVLQSDKLETKIVPTESISNYVNRGVIEVFNIKPTQNIEVKDLAKHQTVFDPKYITLDAKFLLNDNFARQRFSCPFHRDEQGCALCATVPATQIHSYALHPVTDIDFSKRRDFFLKFTKQSLIGDVLQSMYDGISKGISGLLANIQDKIQSFVNMFVDAKRDQYLALVSTYLESIANATGLIAGLASYLYDKFTDTRPFTMMIIFSDIARLSAFLPIWKALAAIIKFARTSSPEVEDNYVTPKSGTIENDSAEPIWNETETMNEYMERLRKYATNKLHEDTIIKQNGVVPDALQTFFQYLSKIIPMNRETLVKLQLFNTLSTALKTVGNLFSWVFALLPNIITDFFKRPSAKYADMINDPQGAFNRWRQLSDLICKNRIIFHEPVTQEMLTEWRTGYYQLKLLATNPDLKSPPAIMATINAYAKDILPMEPTSSERMEPIWIAFYGESKIGKSMMMRKLISNVDAISPEKATETTYTRNAADQYWSGYDPHVHTWTLIDDFCAINTPADPHRDVLEMINLVSNAAVPLPMPSLNDPGVGKKGTLFKSDMIVTLANKASYNVGEITHTAALTNRQHFLIHVRSLYRPSPQRYATCEHLVFDISTMSGVPTARCGCDTKDPWCMKHLAPSIVRDISFNDICRIIQMAKRTKLAYHKAMQKTISEDCCFEEKYAKFDNDIESAVETRIQHNYNYVKQNDDEPKEEVERLLWSLQKWNHRCTEVLKRAGWLLGQTCIKTLRAVRDFCYELWSDKIVRQIIGIMAIAFPLITGVEVLAQIVINNWASPKLMEIVSQSVTPKARAPHKSRVFIQSEIDKQSDTMYREKYIAYIVVRDSETGETFRENATFVKGYTAITTAHSFRSINRCVIETTYKRNGQVYVDESEFTKEHLTFSPTKDLVVIDYTHSMILPFPDASKFINQEPLPEVFSAELVSYNREKVVHIKAGITRTLVDKTYYDADTQAKVKISHLLYSKIPTVVGDCGSTLWYGNRLIGIHMGGTPDGRDSYQIPISPSDFGSNGIVDPLEYHDIVITQAEHPWAFNQNKVQDFGTLSAKDIHFSPSKTKISKSLLHGVFPVTSAPSVLGKNDLRNKSGLPPLYNGIQKYSKEQNVLTYRLLAFDRDAIDDLNRLDTGVKSGYLSLHQAINGDRSIPNCKGVDLSTSCGHGYPATSLGKKAHFKFDGLHYSINSDILQTRLECLRATLRHSIVPQPIIDTLKDELRSFNKIESASTRIFNVYPMEYTILMQQYFGRYFCHFLELHKYDSPIAVGIDPYSKMWHNKICHLLNIGSSCFDGDGKSFDATYNLRELVLVIFDSIIDWVIRDFPEEGEFNKKNERQFLRNLANSGLNVLHLAGNFAFGTMMGVMSGFFLTTIVNCFTIYSHLYNAYLLNVPVHLANHTQFKKNTAMLVFGDDHTVALSDEVKDIFNYQTVKTYLNQLGLTYTPGIKDADDSSITYWPVLETSFLKNTIGSIGGFYVAKLDPNVIYNMMSWVRKSDEIETFTYVNAQTALRFAFFHGTTFFNNIRNQLLKAMPDHTFHTYRELENIFKIYGKWEPEYRSFTNDPDEQAIYTLEDIQQQQTIMKSTIETTQPLNVVLQSAILNMINPLADIVDAIVPHELQMDALGFLGSLDKPTVPSISDRCRPGFFPNMNGVKGLDTSVPLRSDSSSMTLTDKQHFKRGDEMNLQEASQVLCVTPGGYTGDTPQLVQWLTSQSSGDIIFTELVSPNSELATWYNTRHAIGIHPTAVCYVSKPFHHWSGSLVYEIEIFASQNFHRGSLRISFHPGVYNAASVPSEVDLSSQYYTTINLSQKTRKVRLTIPFNSRTPYLELANRNDVSTDALCRRYYTGLLVVSIVKPLIASGVAAPLIDVAVRRAAGKDLKFVNMDMHNSSIQLATSEYEVYQFRVQSDTETEQGSEQVIDMSTGTAPQTADTDVVISNTTAPEPTDHSHDRNTEAVNEKSWSISDALDKRMLFDIVTWNPSSVAMEILAAYDVVNDLTTCELAQIAKNRFTNLRCNVEVMVEIAGSPFQSGALAVVWVPLVNKQNFPLGPGVGFLASHSQVDFMQHMLVQPGVEKSYKMELQYRHPQTSIFPGAGDSLGTLVVIVYSRLSTVAGDNGVRVSMHSRLLESFAATPRPCTLATPPAVFYNKQSQLNDINEYRRAHSKFNQMVIQKQSDKDSKSDKPKDEKSKDSKQSTPAAGVDKTEKVPDNPTVVAKQPEPKAVLTKDPTVKPTSKPNPKRRAPKNAAHFEDHVLDCQALMKKMSNSYYFADTFEPGVTPLTISIANEILFPSGRGTDEKNNGGGILGWFSPMFRAFRGDVRLKIALTVASAAENGPIPEIHGFVTHSQNSFGVVNIGDGALLSASLLQASAGVAGSYLTPSSMNYHNFIITPANPEVVEIEIPYSRIGQFSLIPSYSFGIDFEADPYGLGFLNLVFANPSNAPANVSIRIYAGIGDAARMGIPTFLPPMKIISGNAPDGWTAVPPRARSETEYEYIEVTERIRKPKVTIVN